MKKILSLFILSNLVSLNTFAWISTPEIKKEYSFNFKEFEGDRFSFKTSSDSQEDAFEKAAQACFNHYKKGRRVSMDYGQDIIDICVNPRNI